MATPLETAPPSSQHQDGDDIQDMIDTQEAEALLFRYIVTSAGQLETPPVILKKLAANLGDPQRLPATKILQTAMDHPLSHPLTTLIAIEGLLEGTFEDSVASFESELASSNSTGHATSPWISLTFEKRHDETISDSIISDTPLATDPLIKRQPQKLFPLGRIFLLSIAILYGYLVFKTGFLTPSAIWNALAEQRAALTQSQQAEPAGRQYPAVAPATPPKAAQLLPEDNYPLSPRIPENQKSEPHVTKENSLHSNDTPQKHPEHLREEHNPDLELQREGRTRAPISPQDAVRHPPLKDHPGVITLPGEEFSIPNAPPREDEPY